MHHKAPICLYLNPTHIVLVCLVFVTAMYFMSSFKIINAVYWVKTANIDIERLLQHIAENHNFFIILFLLFTMEHVCHD